MVFTLCIVLGSILGAVPLLLVLRHAVRRGDRHLEALRVQHAADLEALRVSCAKEVDEAVQEERKRAVEALRAKRERDLKPVPMRGLY